MINENIDSLLFKASSLPLSPGVYLMKDKSGGVIYVGKSKALKNRVTSYFRTPENHTAKTKMMVSKVNDFEVIVTETEIEALALENKLIKLHNPKFNIKLKDSKSYPYIKLSVSDEYPDITVVRKRVKDGSKYYGPYSGTSVAYSILNSVKKTFGIPSCKKSFPRDIGTRPCINYEIGNCCGLCRNVLSKNEYREIISEASEYLGGGSAIVKKSLTAKMKDASDNMLYELAATYRDKLKMLDKLQERQKVVGSPDFDADFVSYYCSDEASCVSVLYVRNGVIVDFENYKYDAMTIVDESFFVDFIFNLYKSREQAAEKVYTGFDLSEQNRALLSDSLNSLLGAKVNFIKPEIGDMKRLTELCEKNAREYIRIEETKESAELGTLKALAALLRLDKIPEIIESYDISNYGNENITGGKISVLNGKFNKKAYRTFKIRSTEKQDDFTSMYETVLRRLSHEEDTLPDLILIDGGEGQVKVAKDAVNELGLSIPVYGMVKDEYHKTRTLTDGENEISLAYNQSVYAFIYRIQEEVHRYTISRMQKAKGRSFKKSSLEEIKGIGPTKAKAILSYFGGLKNVKEAEKSQLSMVKCLSKADINNIYEHYHKEEI